MAKAVTDLEKMITAHFDVAKTWDGGSMIFRILVFVSGILTIFLSLDLKWLPVFVFLLSVIVESISWYANYIKGRAEQLKRIHEHWDGFGKQLSPAELSDIKASRIGSMRKLFSRGLMQGVVYSSKEPKGERRVIQNLSESSLWSYQLARKTAVFYLSLSVALILLSFIALDFSVYIFTSQPVLTNVGKVVTATILLIFSLGLIPKCIELFAFSSTAKKIEEESNRLVQREKVNETEALLVLHKYQLARAMSPLIPTWIWRKNHLYLNMLWEERIEREENLYELQTKL